MDIIEMLSSLSLIPLNAISQEEMNIIIGIAIGVIFLLVVTSSMKKKKKKKSKNVNREKETINNEEVVSLEDSSNDTIELEENTIADEVNVEVNEPLLDKEVVNTNTETVTTDEDEENESEDSVSTIDESGNKILIRYNRSFMAKLIQGGNEIQDRYTVLKNHILSYSKVKSRVSWNYESFNIGREQKVKLAIRGKTLLVYVALNPNDYINTKYRFTDCSESTKYSKVPMKLKSRSPRGLKYQLELIDVLLSDLVKVDTPTTNYSYPYQNDEALVNDNLVKIVRLNDQTDGELEVVKYPILDTVNVNEVDNFISNEEALETIVTAEVLTTSGKTEVVNIDTLSKNFNNGDVINLQVLKDRKLVSKSCARVKILGRGSLNKNIEVHASYFSVYAIKMIVLTGGKAYKC